MNAIDKDHLLLKNLVKEAHTKPKKGLAYSELAARIVLFSAHVASYVHCLVFTARFSPFITMDFHFLTDF